MCFSVNLNFLSEFVINNFVKFTGKWRRQNLLPQALSFHCLFIDWKMANSEKNVKLLGISIDNNLSFEDHISALCKIANNQLNAIGRIQK